MKVKEVFCLIIEDPSLRNKYHIFTSRHHAGSLLASFVAKENFDLLLIIPNGGVPVGLGLFEALPAQKIPIDLLIVRKIQIPWNTEAGMGAITPDGQIFLNQKITSHLSISDDQLNRQIERTKQQIEERRKKFKLPVFPSVSNKRVLITDDGIASGFSMIAGAEWLKKLGAKEVIIAVPTAPLDSINCIKPHVKKIICLNIRTLYPFAVADAYQAWYDLDLTEATKYMSKIRSLSLNISD
ncbi:MAG: phosphoribosyltransferase [Candidatus Hodarchaeota archaeon]